ncbi:oligosaccharide flippase family protein [Novosphingobium resinovorum]|jgi:O-antigen/teichoic acid export membrane protein|uniref:Teichoic acid transporter n=1 Tax=Novosphingobium resinovorum TaxID=158500 RepID=A0A1D8A745_9SPHN|nr:MULTISPECIES: oligosaccharide flippase family protein [Sphingomonadaceae]AOR77928.1 teichoic acid transporter [Novosphingobium resinovorum]EJU12041.1 polysaccharide biosynthesis protein [Sphingomonas sp. LH128]MBF7010018.1 oligosaccharide flippase family protein [Novosphingobium sp. HR1a]WJM28041.1 oligosaccharide flippase family protein [Novosphingobium resinovorum]
MTAQAPSAGWAPLRPGLMSRLRGAALRDTNVVVASVVVTNLLRAVSSMILTRLLAPEVFGISGVIASLQLTIALLSDFGFQGFIVRQKDGDRKRFLDTVWTVAVLRSLLLTAIMALLAVPMAHVLGRPELAPLIAAASLLFLVDGLASTSMITALRSGRILRLSGVELFALMMQIAASALLAWAWPTYWAILGGMFIGTGLKSLLSFVVFPDARRAFGLERETLKALWAFSRYVTGSSIIYLMVTQCDKLVLAKFMPLDQFGFYVLAGNLASAPLAFAGNYTSRVLLPAYAALWREGASDLKAQFYARRRLPSILYAAATGGIIGSAPLIIGLFYHSIYAETAFYMQILCISSLLAMPSNAANESLIATGRVSAYFEANLAKLAWLIVMGTAGYLLWGQIGLVVTVGTIEGAALGLKWWRMWQVNLLDLWQEGLFLGAGLVGALLGVGANLVLGPFLT